MSHDLLTLLTDFPALDEQGGTLFVKGTDRGIANLFDVPETDALMDLVTAVPRLREALLKAQTTVERLTRENEGLVARLAESHRDLDTHREHAIAHDTHQRRVEQGLRAEVASLTAALVALTSTERDDDRADAAQMRAGWKALTEELDTVRRVLAEALDVDEDEHDVLALAAKACETIDHLEAAAEGTFDALTKAGAQLDALARGETTPSLDAIRAWAANGGVWLRLWRGDRVDMLRVSVATEDTAGHFRGEVVVRYVDGTSRTYTPPQFATAFGGGHWWRVAPDGSLTVGEKVDAAPDVG